MKAVNQESLEAELKERNLKNRRVLFLRYAFALHFFINLYALLIFWQDQPLVLIGALALVLVANVLAVVEVQQTVHQELDGLKLKKSKLYLSLATLVDLVLLAVMRYWPQGFLRTADFQQLIYLLVVSQLILRAFEWGKVVKVEKNQDKWYLLLSQLERERV